MRAIPAIAFDGIFTFGDPSTIAGFVILGVILSADLQTFRALTHIRQEIGELMPASTDPDSFSPVILEAWDSFIRTANFHINPDPVCARPLPSTVMAMPSHGFFDQFTFFAATALRETFAQYLCAYFPLSSANTSAEPSGSARGRFSRTAVAENCPETKTFTS
jgi:hypothetical protein